MKLNDLDLLQLLPAFMRKDKTSCAMVKALNPEFLDFIKQVHHALILPRLDELPEDILDELANELDVSWYLPDANIEDRREIVRDAYLIHAHFGTPWAIEHVAQQYFGDAQVEEWWEYGAEPYHFRVRTGNVGEGTKQAALFARLVQQIKNARSYFDGILFETSLPAFEIYPAGVLQVVYHINMDMEV